MHELALERRLCDDFSGRAREVSATGCGYSGRASSDHCGQNSSAAARRCIRASDVDGELGHKDQNKDRDLSVKD